ncbi:MAG TPA: 23S rRNA (pseudouridine(1915)-N(3))-methyltransferase RlmH [Gemmatimonadales bacterium]|nr:23S rRNA (pseudouridine(1915)-N(3))-methyltransferase RlmH [Gemmatimonadales bacterium]
MELVLAAVGRLRPSFRQAADEYLERLAHYARIAETEIREASRAGSVERQRAEEAERLTARLPSGAVLVALAREGEAWSSMELSRKLGRWQEQARPVALVIGGSWGLDPALIARAAHRWSLGPLTLPHELARVVVLEQVYRGCTILRGEPYHKGAGGR